MINRFKLEKCLKPNIPKQIRKLVSNLILFNNKHHYERLSEKEVIQKFKGSGLAEYIDFDKLEQPEASKVEQPEASKVEPQPVITIHEKIKVNKVTVSLSHTQAGELFNLLDRHKEEYPELHELVFQAMTQELFGRINNQ